MRIVGVRVIRTIDADVGAVVLIVLLTVLVGRVQGMTHITRTHCIVELQVRRREITRRVCVCVMSGPRRRSVRVIMTVIGSVDLVYSVSVVLAGRRAGVTGSRRVGRCMCMCARAGAVRSRVQMEGGRAAAASSTVGVSLPISVISTGTGTTMLKACVGTARYRAHGAMHTVAAVIDVVDVGSVLVLVLV